ncbi:uncharacterized protein LOC143364079 [Halictus rubicundus]|uniref:uncharacterized protein LOC143364079 n=1 Tax=Halictus rubicundus TaxID=77578 RepID=UPI0040363667
MSNSGSRAEASDTGNPCPRAPVADVSAEDRRVIDDPSNDNGQELDIFMEMPMGGTISCSLCTNNQRFFLQETKWAEHIKSQITAHPDHRIMWKCKRCKKSWEKIQACKCHIPKCKGVVETMDDDTRITCVTCGEKFGTKAGLGQHERHRHAQIRNEKRSQPERRVRATNHPRPSTRASVWSEREIELLIQLSEQFQNEKCINIKVHEHLSIITTKQISDKRSDLKKRRGPTQTAEIAEEEEVDELPTSSSNSAHEPVVEAIDENVRYVENENWRDVFRAKIRENPLGDDEDLKDIEREIMRIAEGEQTSSQDIEGVTGKFTEKLKEGIVEETSRNRSGKVNNRKENDRTRFNKYKYSRYQELYNKCPKKLIEMAVAGEKCEIGKKVELPEKTEVEKLYGSLRGTGGPSTGLPKLGRDRNAASPIKGIWVPITNEEVVAKMRKIKANTAPGVDGIKKVHLMKRGALVVLTKLFNLLMTHTHFPELWKRNRTTLIPKAGKSTDDVGNWRPITIGSLMSRIFSSMLDRRLRWKVQNYKRQKGFTQEDGWYIDETTEGITIGDENASILAFADDIVLIAKDRDEAVRQNKKLHTFLKNIGMEIQASKCHTFQIRHGMYKTQEYSWRVGRKSTTTENPGKA